jgi:hypothetical protein
VLFDHPGRETFLKEWTLFHEYLTMQLEHGALAADDHVDYVGIGEAAILISNGSLRALPGTEECHLRGSYPGFIDSSSLSLSEFAVVFSLIEEMVVLSAGQIDPVTEEAGSESNLPWKQVFTFEYRRFIGSCHGREN